MNGEGSPSYAGRNRRSGDEDAETGEMWLLKVEFSGLFPAKEVKAAYARNVRRFFRLFVAMLNALCKGIYLFASVSPRIRW